MTLNSRTMIVGALLVSLGLSIPASAAIRYVNASRPDDSGDGLSWATAKKNLQTALTAAVSSDEIWVAAGTYKPDQGGGQKAGDRTATFQLQSGVALYGGFAGGETSLSQRNPAMNVTILSGDLAGNDLPGFVNASENSHHVVTASGVGSTAVLDGFTVARGYASSGMMVNPRGAGIFITGSSPMIRNCTVTMNSSNSQGGGIYALNSSPTISNCRIEYNEVRPAGGDGGGLFVESSSPIISGSTFRDNTANGDGGGITLFDTSVVSVFSTLFLGNEAGSGGAVYIDSTGTMYITNVVFSGNVASNGGGIRSAGILNITNCTFAANVAAVHGGGIRTDGAGAQLMVQSSVFWGNEDSDGTGSEAQIFKSSGGSAAIVSYSVFHGGWSGTGSNNLNTDPLFVDAVGLDNTPGTLDDDFRLRPGSPAIDAGDTTALPADVADLDGDLNTAEPIPFDLDGNPRRVDAPFSTDTGVGPAPIVDMGAYEFQSNVSYVDDSATGGNDGSNWTDAFTKLQDALAYAATHPEVSEIWVAAGTYTPDQGGGQKAGDRTATFQLLNGVALYGGFGGTETLLSQRNIAANPTILSGDLAGNDTPMACTQDSPTCDSLGGRCLEGSCVVKANDGENSHHVITGSGNDATAILDGFTITAGNASGAAVNSGGGLLVDAGSSTIRYCRIEGNSAIGSGGVQLNASNSEISFSTVSRNYSQFGTGGLANSGAGDPTIRSCVFDGNTGNYIGAAGCNTSSGLYEDCVFINNRSGLDGGAVGAGSCNITYRRCDFFGNRAGVVGGAIEIQGSTVTLHECRFSLNTAMSQNGGAINSRGNPNLIDIVNCTFSGNSADDFGGGLYHDSGTANVINSTFFANTATTGSGGGMFADGGTLNVTNCILYGNTSAAGTTEADQLDFGAATLSVNYSDIQGLTGGLGGSGNIDNNPFFVDADGPDNIPGTFDDDLRLRPGSPAIDAGDTTALPADALDLDGDANTTEYIPFDLAGNLRQYDDPATTDTGIPGSPVVDMGAYEFFTDCNANDVPDECDISCAGLSGACAMYPGCGGSADCNWDGGGANGIPDECDIAGCMDFPKCDDCNLNGIPDACDIVDMTSDDDNMNGIPDECTGYTGVAGDCTSNDWSCTDNWDLPGNVYPDNDVDTYSVTLDGTDDVFLDVDVSIDTLRLIEASLLTVTQTGTDGDLTIVQSGGLLIEGTLLINNSRVIDVTSGPVRVRDGGLYALDPSRALAPGEGDIVSAGLTIAAGGEVLLTNNMRMIVNGDFIMDGTGACGFCDDETPPCDGNNRGGIIPPPKFSSGDFAEAKVFRNFYIRPPVRFYHNSSVPFDLGGAFINQSTTPRCFDMSGSGLRLIYVFPPPPDQSFEVGGRDIGRTQSGFFTDGHANFSIDSLEVDAGRAVTFRNLHANVAGTNACAEALYVRNLTLRSGSNVTLHNARVYYQSKTQESGVTVQSIGCGALVEMAPCANHGECADGNVCTDDACGPTTGVCTHAPISQLSFGDADRSGIVEVGDILCALQAYAENFSICPKERTDIIPCGKPDGLVEVGDILAFLAAYAGNPSCSDLCP